MKTYPKYKESGVEWLGDVPEGWEIGPVRSACSINDEVLVETTDPLLEIQYVEISDVNDRAGITNYTQLLFGDAPSRARRIARRGDILISTVRTYLRAISEVRASVPNLIVSTGFAVLRPNVKQHQRYHGYLFRSEYFVSEIISRSVGVSYPSVNASEIISLPIPLPPLPEQQTIAAFLDHEVAKIDELIREQERLIELLAEKRQATISHAVTKGLDPNAKLKPSGVEWLGDVPEDWEVVPLKSLCRIFSSNVDKHTKPEEISVKLCNYTDVYYNDVISSSMDFMIATATELEIEKFSLDVNDVIFTKDSESADDIGISSIVVEELPGVICGYHLSIARPFTGVNGLFIKRFFDSTSAKAHFKISANGLTRVSLGQATVRNLSVPTPPLNEQAAIADFLEREVQRFFFLTATAREAIALLQERRSALISAAVTGKIDVRDFVAPALKEA